MGETSLRFNGHFPGGPGLAVFIESKDGEVVVTTGAINCAKLQSNHHQQQTNTQAGCASCCPTNSVKAPKGRISHSMDLLTPSSPVGLPMLSLTTISWLPWGKVAMPLISPLMPVPHEWVRPDRSNTSKLNCTCTPCLHRYNAMYTQELRLCHTFRKSRNNIRHVCKTLVRPTGSATNGETAMLKIQKQCFIK